MVPKLSGLHQQQNLLKVHNNSNAVILSTEILSTGWYAGKDRPMMVLNCLFRSGSAAILITNKKSANKISKYRLVHTLRTQGAFDDIAYNAALGKEDLQGITGFTFKKDAVVHAFGELLRSHLHVLGSSILPLEEKIRYGISVIRKRFLDKSTQLYVPNFRKVIQHYCLPTSGKAIAVGIGREMKLKEEEMEVALMTLHRFGNQSSSSLWYELAYMEAKERVKEGERVLQLGIGTGPKCTSLIWECNRLIIGEAQQGPWADCVNSYPASSLLVHVVSKSWTHGPQWQIQRRSQVGCTLTVDRKSTGVSIVPVILLIINLHWWQKRLFRYSFQPFGRVVDIYIGGKRDCSGSIFAFVRFEDIHDAKVLEKEMSKFRCGHCILRVNIAHYQKQHGSIGVKANTSYTTTPTKTHLGT
ncbi:unnamed protein product [Lactuca virosa]|uniref:very-long-chain 3-oxoacyl-CoA synthase n=1 Tax=Lactuca virosa TaxID=75947 RepID=A0AAU9NMP0_9ASTR|nr:unnamed protein product [Lactuca virosa]